MDNRMAVRADRPQVVNGIHLVLLVDGAQLPKMMNMNEALCDRTIPLAEIHITDHAAKAVKLKTSSPGNRVPLVCIYQYLATSPLDQSVLGFDLVSQSRVCVAKAANFECGGNFRAERPNEVTSLRPLPGCKDVPPFELALR